jgi:hypothetical protein
VESFVQYSFTVEKLSMPIDLWKRKRFYCLALLVLMFQEAKASFAELKIQKGRLGKSLLPH